MPGTQTVLNGNRPSWVSITLDADGLVIGGVTEINFSDNLEPGKPQGTDPIAIGYTRGKYTADFDVTMYLQEFDLLADRLGGIGYGETLGFYNIMWAEPSINAGEPFTVEIVGRISKVEQSNSDGTDAAKVKVTFAVIAPILRNGKSLVAPDPTQIDLALV